MKKFLYLIQGRKINVLKYKDIRSDESDIISLTFDEEIKTEEFSSITNIFYPGSTWAEGRNKQFEIAKGLNFKYIYYIFIDDDVHFIKGSFKEFEQNLLKYQPAIGVPLLTIIQSSFRYRPSLKIQNPVAFDTQFQAFHIDTINDNILMPLVTKFDSKSWYYCCEIVNFLILSYYKGRVIQFNKIIVDNVGHHWDEENMLSIDPHSKYIGGVTKDGINEIKQYIIDTYGNQPQLSNSLFHNDNYRKFIYLPRGFHFIKTIIKYILKLKLRTVKTLIRSYIVNILLYNYPKELVINEKITEK